MGTGDKNTHILGMASRLLDGQGNEDNRDSSAAEALLEVLGYRSLKGLEKAQASRLLRAGTKIRRIFQFQSSEAPGLYILGGEADPATIGLSGSGISIGSLAGSGPTFGAALEACLGEGVEYLSQIERDDDIFSQNANSDIDYQIPETEADALLHRLHMPAGMRFSEIECVVGQKLETDSSCILPADLVLRRGSNGSPTSCRTSLSLGCAAGRTMSHAKLSALMELVERDAVAHWWLGNQPGRPIRPDVMEQAGIEGVISATRQDVTDRNTWFIDISTGLNLPVVAAVSLTPAGNSFALGLGAHPILSTAVQKAFNELCQTEMAYQIVDMKEEAYGSEKLNAADFNHRKRQGWVGAKDSPILKPQGSSRLSAPIPDGQTIDDLLSKVIDRFQERSISVYVVDLTRPEFQIPAIWAGSADLIPYPCEVIDGCVTATAQLSSSQRPQYGFSLV